MRKLLKKNQKIFMAPENIKGALSTTIKKVTTKSIEVEIDKKDLKYYKKDNKIEMFTIVDAGMLYFKPTITDVLKEANIIKVEYDKKTYDLLQRREFSRVEIQKEFKLFDTDNKEYICVSIDISAGGMKFVTEAPLTPVKDYLIEFSLDSGIPIRCFFKPIRVDGIESKKSVQKNIVSGRFIALKNIDKIAIVQFCFRKEMESTIK